MLGGEEREMTMLFSDVRGFTAISEIYKDDPQGLTSLMNRLLTPLTERDRRPRRNHRQIHRRCGHGILERTIECSEP